MEKKEYEFVYNDWVKVTDEQDGWTEIPLEENTDIKLPGRYLAVLWGCYD